MKRILIVLDRIEEIFLLPTISFSVGLLFMQVIFRHIFNNSITWSEELARYLFIWQIWIGISYCAKNGTHIRITLLKDLLSDKANRILEIIVIIVWFGFGCFVIYQGYNVVMRIASFGQKSPALQMPMEYAYLSIPVGATLMNIRLVQNLFRLLKKEAEA
ncbi:MAG: TRAP transporter small permease [Tissierellia bacterium]|nr:TRAP transporter small permease [Tissierellia bacterium]